MYEIISELNLPITAADVLNKAVKIVILSLAQDGVWFHIL